MINKDFILKNEGNFPFLYVPVKEKRISESFRGETGTPLGQSGATIGIGIDLGQRTTLADMSLPKELEEKLKPYLGLKKADAQAKIKEIPLKITDSECQLINSKFLGNYTKFVTACWEKNTPHKFAQLTDNQQTCIFDIVYQHGNIFSVKHSSHLKFKPLIDLFIKLDWRGCHDFLTAFDNGYLKRNKHRAELLNG